MTGPRLSVVMACHNGLPHLRAQLEALMQQRPPFDWELIVVDDRSTDASAQVAGEYVGRIGSMRIEPGEGRGQGAARNLGVARSRGEALVFVDQDDVVGAGYLAAMAGALDTHELVAARMDLERLNADWVRAGRIPAQAQGLGVDFLPWAYGATLGARRSLFEQLGGFRDFGGAAEDIDFCWRAQLGGAELFLEDAAVLHYRLRDTPADLFRQGRTYGRAGAQLFKEYRSVGMHRYSVGRALRSWLAIGRLAMTARSRSDRARLAFALGRRLGCLEGSIRFRVAFL